MKKKPIPERMKKQPLAEYLKIDRKKLYQVLRMDGAPLPDREGQYNVKDTEAFIEKRTEIRGEATMEIKDLRAKKLKLECEGLILELQVERGEYIPKNEIKPIIAAFNTQLVTNLRQKFEYELPNRYVGKNAIECSQLNIQAIDSILLALKNGQTPLQ